MEQDFLEEDMMLLWGSGWEDRENNGGYVVNNTDRYNITYRDRRCRRYFQIRGRGALLEAVGHNYRCVSGGAVVSGEFVSSRGDCCHQICLIGGQGGNTVVQKHMLIRSEGAAYYGRGGGRGEKGGCRKF